MFQNLTKRSFIVNLLIAVAAALLLVAGFFFSLSWITNHGDEKEVPAVTGMNVDAAISLLQSDDFNVSVQDSVYIDTASKGSVVRQSPKPDELVKSGRTIYLTINRSVAPLVDMPDLRGFSFLSAQLYLQTLGLKLGDTTYTPDIAKNAVKDQLLNGQPIAPGTQVNMGSVISLVLGDGVSDDVMEVPDLQGMSLSEAHQYLATMNVSLGAVVADPDVRDTANAFVYKQSPAPFVTDETGAMKKNKISPGQVVDVWLSVQAPPPDSTQTINQ